MGYREMRCKLVPKKGLEPPHPCEYMDLNHARLPIPPLRHGRPSSARARRTGSNFESRKCALRCQIPAPKANIPRSPRLKSGAHRVRDVRIESFTAGRGRSYTSFASSEISVLFANSFEIGHPPLAPAAAASNTSFVAPGTFAVVVRAILVIANPPSTFASVTAA